MKIQEIKHNHSLTDLLKVALFSMLMLAPALSVASRCLYVIANKNAYQSYSDSYVETTQVISNTSQFVEGQSIIATYKAKENESTTYGAYIHYDSISIDWTDYGFQENTYNQFRLFNSGLIQLRDTNNTQYSMNNVWGNTLKTFTFIYNSMEAGSNLNGNVDYTALFYQQSKLDNVFEYSVSKLEDSQMFNWTTNTAIYTGVQAMCSQLGITTPVIAEILVYWFLLTVIYVIIDIILKTFTVITHMLGSKKA